MKDGAALYLFLLLCPAVPAQPSAGSSPAAASPGEGEGAVRPATPVTEETLKQDLRKGMTPEDVTALFGAPARRMGDAPGRDFLIEYTLAPERRPDTRDRSLFVNGFSAFFPAGAGEPLLARSGEPTSRARETRSPGP